jgi:dihydropteroate synthase
MLTLIDLVQLAMDNRGDLDKDISPFRIGDRTFDTDATPVLMGVVNLSRDSTYRESVAPTFDDAIRKALIMREQGAHVIDVGAESSRGDAARVDAQGQIAQLVPLIVSLVERNVPVSVESYEPQVVRAALHAGASVVNLTGTKNEDDIYSDIAAHNASLIMCFTPGETVRDDLQVRIHADPIPPLVEHFEPRIKRAKELGVTSISIDPGLGFFYGSSVDPIRKAQHQAQVLLHSFRLRPLGAPVCQIMPHAFDVFQEEFRTAEGVFTVLGRLGGVGVLRVHEVARVAATVRMLNTVGISLPSDS